jgi:hypothetical protein
MGKPLAARFLSHAGGEKIAAKSKKKPPKTAVWIIESSVY